MRRSNIYQGTDKHRSIVEEYEKEMELENRSKEAWFQLNGNQTDNLCVYL